MDVQTVKASVREMLGTSISVVVVELRNIHRNELVKANRAHDIFTCYSETLCRSLISLLIERYNTLVFSTLINFLDYNGWFHEQAVAFSIGTAMNKPRSYRCNFP
jgi:hypothetical protein